MGSTGLADLSIAHPSGGQRIVEGMRHLQVGLRTMFVFLLELDGNWFSGLGERGFRGGREAVAGLRGSSGGLITDGLGLDRGVASLPTC